MNHMAGIAQRDALPPRAATPPIPTFRRFLAVNGAATTDTGPRQRHSSFLALPELGSIGRHRKSVARIASSCSYSRGARWSASATPKSPSMQGNLSGTSPAWPTKWLRFQQTSTYALSSSSQTWRSPPPKASTSSVKLLTQSSEHDDLRARSLAELACSEPTHSS
jgi:hypothetical protein